MPHSEKTNLVEKLIGYFDERLVSEKIKSRPKHMELFYRFIRDHLQKIIEAPGVGRPRVLYNVYSPPELYYAFDFAPYSPGFVALKAGEKWGVSEFFELVEGYGIPQDICSFRRLQLGMALDNRLPAPDFIVNTNVYCITQPKLFEILGNLYKVPTFNWDYPYGIGREAIEYYRRQVEDMIRFFEEQTGQRLDYDRLNEVVDNSKTACSYWEKISRLRAKIPSPVSFRDVFHAYEMHIISLGSSGGAQFYQALYEDLLGKAEPGKAAVPGERYRLAWWGGYPMFGAPFMNWMAEEYKASTVVDFFDPGLVNMSAHILDISDPLEYIAARAFNDPIIKFSGLHSDFRGDLLRATRERQANASVIFPMFSCKQIAGTAGLLKDAMARELGLPTLILDGDHCDPTLVPQEQLVSRVEEFFERLD